jgi:hypothetical protein
MTTLAVKLGDRVTRVRICPPRATLEKTLTNLEAMVTLFMGKLDMV